MSLHAWLTSFRKWGMLHCTILTEHLTQVTVKGSHAQTYLGEVVFTPAP